MFRFYSHSIGKNGRDVLREYTPKNRLYAIALIIPIQGLRQAVIYGKTGLDWMF